MSKDLKKVWIHGISGRMGLTLEAEIAKSFGWKNLGGSERRTPFTELTAGLRDAQLVIDFSSVEGNEILSKAVEESSTKNLSFLICTTGLNSQEKEVWRSMAKSRGMRLLFAPNTSIGVLMLMKSALAVVGLSSQAGFDIEIEECHHRHKSDIPSGTTLFLAESLHDVLPSSTLVTNRTEMRNPGEIGIVASRGGGVFGEHRIRFLGDFEEFTLSHRAFSRELFAKGALVLGEWLLKQKAGLYTLHDVKIETAR